MHHLSCFLVAQHRVVFYSCCVARGFLLVQARRLLVNLFSKKDVERFAWMQGCSLRVCRQLACSYHRF